MQEKFSQEQYDQDYELKLGGLEAILGPMHNLVGHAIIPFAVGGAVDMYYFPNHISGTGFATMELLDPEGNGPKPNNLGTYELVAFTKINFENSEDNESPFNKFERRFCGIFTRIGYYSMDAAINPGATADVPESDAESVYLVFDKYPADKDLMIGERKHHLLLCLEVHRSEIEYARQEGGDALIEKLKMAGHYPYSDLNRDPVV